MNIKNIKKEKEMNRFIRSFVVVCLTLLFGVYALFIMCWGVALFAFIGLWVNVTVILFHMILYALWLSATDEQRYELKNSKVKNLIKIYVESGKIELLNK